jgi:hypothetical protein
VATIAERLVADQRWAVLLALRVIGEQGQPRN